MKEYKYLGSPVRDWDYAGMTDWERAMARVRLMAAGVDVSKMNQFEEAGL